jgi:anti-sigma B factor antagonist
MNITKVTIDDYSIVKIDGRLDTVSSAAFEPEIDRFFRGVETNVIFNCSGLNYISSSGLRVFLVAQKRADANNGKLCLCNMQPAIMEILDISGFSAIFRIYDTQEEALEQLK